MAWFVFQGYNTPAIGKMLYLHSRVLNYTIAHNESQFLALRAIGCLQSQVAEMVRSLPNLWMLNKSYDLTQAEVCFSTRHGRIRPRSTELSKLGIP